MSHAMYTALSGAVAEERRLETITDNFANSDTAGFKSQRLTYREVAAAQGELDPRQTPHIQVEIAATQTDFTQGTVRHTNAPLDVALRGPGFFAVHTPDGERLTRQGAFIHASDGFLRTQGGHAVMGESGPIAARTDLPMSIDAHGDVYSGEDYVATLKRTHVPDSNALVREGNSLWRASDGAQQQAVLTPIEVGSLEKSNVNMVTTMTQLLNTQRSYEMYHRAIENVRALEQKSAQELG
jgi:flagellar basal-body rod protein FlgF